MTRTKRTTIDEKTSVTPKLRFPEFRDRPAWARKVGGDLFTNRKEVGEDGLPIYSVTVNEGMVPRASFDRDFYDIADSAGNKKAYKGDIAYNMMRMWQGAQGVAPADCMVSPAYVVLEPQKGACAEFFAYFFKLPQSLELLTATSRGLTKDRLRLYFDDFARMRLCAPEHDEQSRIAACLASIDELIGAESQKLDALKAHKKGLMRQLFPREGETLPRLRFSEFQGMPAWEERTLGQLVAFHSGGTPSKTNSEFWNGSVPWVSAKDMKQFWLVDAQDRISTTAVEAGAKLVPAGTVLILVRGMTLLKDVPVCVARREMSFNQDVKALRARDGLDGVFLALMMMSVKDQLLKMVTVAGHGTGKLDTDGLKAMVLALPSVEEQQRIASCISSLDDLITAQVDHIGTLKAHKQGLMRQLFPQPTNAIG